MVAGDLADDHTSIADLFFFLLRTRLARLSPEIAATSVDLVPEGVYTFFLTRMVYLLGTSVNMAAN